MDENKKKTTAPAEEQREEKTPEELADALDEAT